MSEKDQRVAESIWKKTKITFQEHLAKIYVEYKNKTKQFKNKENNIEGILINNGTPHEPALLLEPDGNLRWVQYGWTPEPRDNGKIPDMEFCIIATEIVNNFQKTKESEHKIEFSNLLKKGNIF